LNSLFCRHNRFTADCPICSKGTVLDAGAASPAARPRAGAKPRASKAAGAAAQFRGPYAAVRVEDGEVRLEKVPGGLRLGHWSHGSLARTAPVLLASDLPELVAAARERSVLSQRDQDSLDAALAAGPAEPTEPAAVAVSPGRAGDMREELRFEALDDGMLRVARWLYRPNAGWELQDAPVMLPAKRYAEALSRAVGAGLVPSTTAVSPSTSRSTFTTPT
jgi:hypothetical protein